jgi:hypothetical protein
MSHNGSSVNLPWTVRYALAAHDAGRPLEQIRQMPETDAKEKP